MEYTLFPKGLQVNHIILPSERGCMITPISKDYPLFSMIDLMYIYKARSMKGYSRYGVRHQIKRDIER